MSKDERTVQRIMTNMFMTKERGLAWASEWAEVCIKITPTPENIERQYKAIAVLEEEKGE